MQNHFQVDRESPGVLLILQFIIRFKEIMHLIQSNHIFISSFCNFYMGKYQQYCSLTRGLD